MGNLEQASAADLLTHLAGKPVADALMDRYDGLTNLSKASLDELQLVKGVGQSKAAAIKSAFLLAQKLSQETFPEFPLMDTPERVADYLREANRAYTVENLQVVYLNTRKRMIGFQIISQGTLDMILVHAREVFAGAIIRRAASIVLAHNHPSGDPTPSAGDIQVTRDLIRAGQLLKIEVIDHIIMGRRTEERPKDYASLRELGYFAGY